MSITIGIDIGGSATKIVGFRQTGDQRELLAPLFIRATDPVTSVYGAFGRFTSQNGLSLAEIDEVKITGVGSTHLGTRLYSLPCNKVPEFDAIGLGGLYLSGLDEAIVVSMGTGTAIVYAKRGAKPEYLGGTGVGGGTLVGLSRLLLQANSFEHVIEMTEHGDLSKIDLRISDMMKGGAMRADLTAANFGNVSEEAGREDVALGLLNTIYESIAMLALFAARAKGVSHVVLTGKMSATPYAEKMFRNFSDIFGTQFVIPAHSPFGTVIGAALYEENV